MTVEEILAALREIVEGAQNDDGTERALTDEEMDRYEELEGQLLGAQRREGIAERASQRAATQGPVVGRTQTNQAGTATGDRNDESELERAFCHWLATGQENQDIAELRAQSEGTGSEGGYTVPTRLMNRMTERRKAFGGIERVADVMNTPDGAPISWFGNDDVDNTAERVNENAAPASGADLVFQKTQLGAYSYSSAGASGNPLRVPVELLSDSVTDMEARVMDRLGMRLARSYAPDLISGTGANEPQGLLYGFSAPGTSAALNVLRSFELNDDTDGITYDDLVTFTHAVDPAYRDLPGMAWVFNDSTLELIEKIKDTNGRPILKSGDESAATPYGRTILGYPVIIDQGVSDIDVDNNDVAWGAFGNIFEGFKIRRVTNVVVIRDPYTSKLKRQVEFVAWGRIDSIQDNRDAYVALVGEE